MIMGLLASSIPLKGGRSRKPEKPEKTVYHSSYTKLKLPAGWVTTLKRNPMHVSKPPAKMPTYESEIKPNQLMRELTEANLLTITTLGEISNQSSEPKVVDPKKSSEITPL